LHGELIRPNVPALYSRVREAFESRVDFPTDEVADPRLTRSQSTATPLGLTVAREGPARTGSPSSRRFCNRSFRTAVAPSPRYWPRSPQRS
jgi:hypothetical protein